MKKFKSLSENNLKEAALFFHQYPKAGKLEIQATKPLGNQRDLALAYSPGVAAPCKEIFKNPDTVKKYTAKQNLVAVISNGTAVLGLGSIGALASKPVMEGKAVLFKKFANIDVFDIEINETNTDKFVDIVTSLEPTFGGINLEDIKAPECFTIEEKLRKKMNIPIFHDDQHGTAIIVGAAVINALYLSNKKIENAKFVTSGAGAAAIACLNMLISLGAQYKNIWVTDTQGVIYKNRDTNINNIKHKFAQNTNKRTLEEVIKNADVFLGLSIGNILKENMIKSMAKNPLILALANPIPEIMPEKAEKIRSDVIICTGRSDYPNQVNNVLCFPYIFRGALDVGASTINEAMKLAVVKAIAKLARHDSYLEQNTNINPNFGPKYLIPSPFDKRLIVSIAPAVAKAAIKSGIAKNPINNFNNYINKLNRFIFRSGLVMKPIIQKASQNLKKIIYSEGEDERVLRASQVLIEDNIAQPILIGRPKVILSNCKKFGLNILPDKDFQCIDPNNYKKYQEYLEEYLLCANRQGITPYSAKNIMRTNNIAIAALALRKNDVHAMICGINSKFINCLRDIKQIIGYKKNTKNFYALSLLISPNRTLFLTDTFVSENPTVAELVNITYLSSVEIKKFNINPKIALLSMSNFGSRNTESSHKMREATKIIWKLFPDLEIDGEMQGDAALNEKFRFTIFPKNKLTNEANLLVFPNLDSANIALNLLKISTNAVHVGPILLGTLKPAHILTPSVTSRGIVNISAIACIN